MRCMRKATRCAAQHDAWNALPYVSLMRFSAHTQRAHRITLEKSSTRRLLSDRMQTCHSCKRLGKWAREDIIVSGAAGAGAMAEGV